jgi:hypothetical protein
MSWMLKHTGPWIIVSSKVHIGCLLNPFDSRLISPLWAKAPLNFELWQPGFGKNAMFSYLKKETKKTKTCYERQLGFYIRTHHWWFRQTGITIPGNGGVETLQLWTTRTILSVKMDRENSLTLLLPECGSNPIHSDPQSKPPTHCTTETCYNLRCHKLLAWPVYALQLKGEYCSRLWSGDRLNAVAMLSVFPFYPHLSVYMY